jgi:hypothetical protein
LGIIRDREGSRVTRLLAGLAVRWMLGCVAALLRGGAWISDQN